MKERKGIFRNIRWAVLLPAVLGLLVLAACGRQETVEEQKETEQITVTFLYASRELTDLGKVQEAVNAVTVPEIGVEIAFRQLSLADSMTDYSLWINSGEQIDLMCFLAQDIMQYITAGDLLPLESRLSEETTPTILSLDEEFGIGVSSGGHVYGLSTVPANSGWQPGIIIRKDWLEETEYEKKEIYSLEDITEIFAQVKENHPEQYPYAPLAIGLSSGSSWASSLMDLMIAGNNVFSGALESPDSVTVVHYFDTDAYRTYLETLAEWYKAGYIMEDAATMDISAVDLMASGQVASFSNNQEPNQFGAENYGFELAGLPTGKTMFSGGGGIPWGVPKTAGCPEGAVRFLELLYSDSELMNLIMRGIEGEHWVMVSEEKGFIDYPDGTDASNTGYGNLYGVWGDQRQLYNFNHDVTREANEAFTRKARENTYQNLGFTYEESSVSDQMLACQAVLNKYQKALETGALGDGWEKVYREMLGELENAGIEEIVEDTQRQLDAFLDRKDGEMICEK